LGNRLTSQAADTGPTWPRLPRHLRRALGTAHTLAPGGQRQIQLQDACLAQRALHLHRVQQFAQLARGAAVVAGEGQLGQLLRQRAAAAQGRTVALVVLPGGEQLIDLSPGARKRSSSAATTRAAASR
jgi:hypothetical protein